MQRFVRVAIGLVAIFAIGFADVVTGPDFSLSLLYVVVVALLAWRADRLSALVAAFFAAAVYTQASLETSAASVGVVAWNGVGRAIIYAGVALLISELRADQARLRSVDREREEFLSIVAHELRQPVAAIAWRPRRSPQPPRSARPTAACSSPCVLRLAGSTRWPRTS